MKNSKGFTSVHPMIVFWLGLLTGAVIVSLIFLYRAMIPSDYESSLLRYNYRTAPTTEINQLMPEAYGAGTPLPIMPQPSVEAGTPLPIITR